MAIDHQNPEKQVYPYQLFARHDLDLLTFKNLYNVNLTKALYCSLKAFVKGEAFVIVIPEERGITPTFKRKYYGKLRLHTEKDADVIEMIEKIAKGYRNCFFKNILRMYMRQPLTELFLEDPEDIGYFNNKIEILKDGVRRADAASMKARYKQGKTFESNAFESNVKRKINIEPEDENKEDVPLSEEEASSVLNLFSSFIG